MASGVLSCSVHCTPFTAKNSQPELTASRRSSLKMVDKLLCLLDVAVRIQDFVQSRVALFLIEKLHELFCRQVCRLLRSSVLNSTFSLFTRSLPPKDIQRIQYKWRLATRRAIRRVLQAVGKIWNYYWLSDRLILSDGVSDVHIQNFRTLVPASRVYQFISRTKSLKMPSFLRSQQC